MQAQAGSRMQTLSAKDAKYGFGRLIDLARAEPVAVAKHGRPVVVVMSVEEFWRLKAVDEQAQSPQKKRKT
jgi:prevent-host-death family protein